MEFTELVKLRQSVRTYESTPVEKDKLLKCLETARLSPSANNAQPWKFIVVDEQLLKKKVADAINILGMNKFAREASIIIAIVNEKRDIISTIATSIQEKDYSSIDIGIAVNQFCLQASELGLSTCILGWFNEKEVKKLLNVPKGKRLPLLITLGYSSTPIRSKSRKNLDDIINWNQYQ